MRDYELLMVVSPEDGDEGYAAAVDRTEQFLTERGGKVMEVDRWGRRRLAYPISRYAEGFYAVIRFSLGPQEVRALESNLDMAEDVLRHLVVRLDEVMQPQGAGEER